VSDRGECGVLPRPRTGAESAGPSSPRTWGCSRHVVVLVLGADVLPTHVGVLP